MIPATQNLTPLEILFRRWNTLNIPDNKKFERHKANDKVGASIIILSMVNFQKTNSHFNKIL